MNVEYFLFFFYLDKEISSEIVFNELLLGKKISQEKMYLFGAGGRLAHIFNRENQCKFAGI